MEIKKTEIILFFFFLSVVAYIKSASCKNTTTCEYLPKDCKRHNYIENMAGVRSEKVVCPSWFIDFDSAVNTHKCLVNVSFVNLVYFNLEKSLIFDSSVRFKSIINFFNNYISHYFTMHFRNVKGFDVNLNYSSRYKNYLMTYFYDTKLSFYFDGKLIKQCSFANNRFSFNKSSKNLFTSNLVNYIVFIRPVFPTQICPYFLQKSNMYGFTMTNMIDTFYIQNILRFVQLKDSELAELVHTSIQDISFRQLDSVNIDSRILHTTLFINLEKLELFGDVISIQTGLFRAFKSLKKIVFGNSNTRKLFQRGIDWMIDLNSEIRVELADAQKLSISQKEDVVHIKIEFMAEDQIDNIIFFDTVFSSDIFPDEDFCIYAKYPFNQLVLLTMDKLGKRTCTFSWIVQYYDVYTRSFELYDSPIKIIDPNVFSGADCFFDKM